MLTSNQGSLLEATKKQTKFSAKAYHEAGHLLAAVRCKIPFDFASIEKDVDSNGEQLTVQRMIDYYKEQNSEEIFSFEALCLCILAGEESERHFKGKVVDKSDSRILSNWIEELGYSQNFYDRMVCDAEYFVVDNEDDIIELAQRFTNWRTIE